MPRFGLVSLTLLTIASASASAVEVVPAFVDMRLDLQGAGLDYELDVNGSETDQSFDTGTRLGVSWLGSLGLNRGGGCVWGLGLHWNWNEDELTVAGTKKDVALQVYTVDAYLGYALPFNQNLQLEIVPLVGFGQAYVNIEGGEKGHQDAWEVGLVSNLTYTFDGGFQFGGTVGYYRSEANDIQTDIAEYSATLDRLVVGGFLGFRL